MKALFKKNNITSIQEIPFPKEREGYSIIKVKYMGLCRTDIDVIENKFDIDNIVVGHEVSGSIIQSETFDKDTYVGINPYTEDGMHGLTEDGFFSEYISVKDENLFPVKNEILATYLEPIAASLLDVKNKDIAVYGSGRIPNTIFNILKRTNPTVELIYKDTDKEYDLVIQAEPNSLNDIISKTKKEGTIVIRSRTPINESFDTLTFIKKKLTINSSYYSDFNSAVDFINKNEDFVMDYIGDIYQIEDWEKAITASKNSSKKIFLRF